MAFNNRIKKKQNNSSVKLKFLYPFRKLGKILNSKMGNLTDDKIEEHHRFSEAPPQYEMPQPSYSQQAHYAAQPVHIPQPTNVTYVLQQPNVVLSVRDTPVRCVCPNCRANILTQLKYQSGIAAWLIAGGLCLFGLGCGCCLLPFCIDGKY